MLRSLTFFVEVQFLGGGFHYCLTSPLFGEDFQFDTYFSNGLVQPPTRLIDVLIFSLLVSG